MATRADKQQYIEPLGTCGKLLDSDDSQQSTWVITSWNGHGVSNQNRSRLAYSVKGFGSTTKVSRILTLLQLSVQRTINPLR